MYQGSGELGALLISSHVCSAFQALVSSCSNLAAIHKKPVILTYRRSFFFFPLVGLSGQVWSLLRDPSSSSLPYALGCYPYSRQEGKMEKEAKGHFVCTILTRMLSYHNFGCRCSIIGTWSLASSLRRVKLVVAHVPHIQKVISEDRTDILERENIQFAESSTRFLWIPKAK